jgi:hypothetical protein
MRGLKRHRSARILAAGKRSCRISAAANMNSPPTFPLAPDLYGHRPANDDHLTAGHPLQRAMPCVPIDQCNMTWMLRGLAASRTEMVRVSTPEA